MLTADSANQNRQKWISRQLISILKKGWGNLSFSHSKSSSKLSREMEQYTIYYYISLISTSKTSFNILCRCLRVYLLYLYLIHIDQCCCFLDGSHKRLPAFNKSLNRLFSYFWRIASTGSPISSLSGYGPSKCLGAAERLVWVTLYLWVCLTAFVRSSALTACGLFDVFYFRFCGVGVVHPRISFHCSGPSHSLYKQAPRALRTSHSYVVYLHCISLSRLLIYSYLTSSLLCASTQSFSMVRYAFVTSSFTSLQCTVCSLV